MRDSGVPIKGSEHFSRIQFTPDLLPSDITGSEVLYTESGQPTFRFEAGLIGVIDFLKGLPEATAGGHLSTLEKGFAHAKKVSKTT